MWHYLPMLPIFRNRPKGLTLVELLISMAVMSLLFLVIFETFSTAFKIYSGETSRTDNLAEANRAMDTMQKELRFAREMRSAAATNVSFWYFDENSNSTSEASEIITYSWNGTAGGDIIRAKGTSSNILAKKVQSFGITYNSGTLANIRTITLSLQIKEGDESIYLHSTVRPRNL
ncbi:MAG: prepilin-type N-terminal cleavage/methylation domain-containing protein [bacterium]